MRSLVPFTSMYMSKAGILTVKLTCIAYFEVQFISATSPTGNPIPSREKYDKFCFGVTTYHDIQKCHSSSDQFSFVYNHNGRIMHARNTFANDCYYRFNPCDVVGCGIVYPPLAANNGQMFFTRNGEVVHTEDFPNKEYLHYTWFPFAMNSRYSTHSSPSPSISLRFKAL